MLQPVPSNAFIIIYILCVIAGIIVGRHLSNFMNVKCEFTPSKVDMFIWLFLPVIGGPFTLISLIICAFIEVNIKE